MSPLPRSFAILAGTALPLFLLMQDGAKAQGLLRRHGGTKIKGQGQAVDKSLTTNPRADGVDASIGTLRKKDKEDMRNLQQITYDDAVVTLEFEEDTTDERNNAPGTLIGNAVYASDALGSYLVLDQNAAQAQYVSLGTPATLNFGANQDFTVSLWTRTVHDFSQDSPYDDPALISNKDWRYGRNKGWILGVARNGRWKWNIGDGTNRCDYDGPAEQLTDGQWHHIVVSHDRASGVATMFFDGDLVAQRACLDGVGDVTSGLPTSIGTDGAPGDAVWPAHFTGDLDKVALFNQALDASHVMDLYLAGRSFVQGPTNSPTKSPTSSPTVPVTAEPTVSPTKDPTGTPTVSPIPAPTGTPTTTPPTGAPTTGTPTVSPTPSPTSSPTTSPTNNPTTTPAPTNTATPVDCPADPNVDEYIALQQGGDVRLVPYGSLDSATMCTLTLVTEEGHVIPVARSYEGNDWEKSSGEFAAFHFFEKDFDCGSSGCSIELPPLEAGSEYRVASYVYNLVDPVKDVWARLLEMGTFGVDPTELNTLSGGTMSMSDWVEDQMVNGGMTSHREFWRSKANPRWPFTERVGKSDSPCNAGSRWKKYTFTRKDTSTDSYNKNITAIKLRETNAAGPYILIVDGQARTIVDEVTLAEGAGSFTYDQEHEICDAPEPPSLNYPGGKVWLRRETNGPCVEIDRDGAAVANFPISFDGYDYSREAALKGTNIPEPLVLDLSSVTLTDVTEELDLYPVVGGQEFILNVPLTDEVCDQIPTFASDGDQPIFGRLVDGTYLQWDPRLLLEENTLTGPLPDGGGTTQLTTQAALCSNVPRTYLNAESCFLSTDENACGVNEAPDFNIALSDENIQRIYTATGRYVYAMDGLAVVDSLDDKIPHVCQAGTSRFVKDDSGPCAEETGLESTLATTLQGLLTNPSDSNPYTTDIFIAENSCTATADPHVSITVESACWTRVHPEHLDVWDLTYWSFDNTHPGNPLAASKNDPNPIKKWAEAGESRMIFPAIHPTSDTFNHPMERWYTHSTKFDRIGRLGDTVAFKDLHNELRVTALAAEFNPNLSGSSGPGVVICGSQGEVANVAAEGSWYDVAADETRDTTNTTDFGFQRKAVWTSIVLSASDQLRQRMAFALDQVLVVVKDAVGSSDRNTEVFLQYYDILVRGCFENFRSVLKDTSYHPLMAENLSFLKSQSRAYLLTRGINGFADENFAREIMQLFTIGLYKLNRDGTNKLDEEGVPIRTYSMDDIESYSRAWTGFDYQKKRGNTEDYEMDEGNRMDPLQIQAAWRDRFPKTDLTGGYIGDGYPLCEDMPDKMFLRKGATYRLLGSSAMPELMYEDEAFANLDGSVKRLALSQTSGLYAELCDPIGGTCQYPMDVVLSSTISCPDSSTEVECSTQTARVVQVDDYFYEYIPAPCVQQAFYSDAKTIMYRGENSDSLCANPRLTVAMEACCSSDGSSTSANPIYDGERVSYDEAVARCTAPDDMCTFGSSGTGMTFDDVTFPEWKRTYHWTSSECFLKVKVMADGKVALVHETGESGVVAHVDETENDSFFPVFWDGDSFPYPDAPGGCGTGCAPSGAHCLCDTSVSDGFVFSSMPASADDVFAQLVVGAIDPSTVLEPSEYAIEGPSNGVTAYHVEGALPFSTNTIFKVVDGYSRRTFFYKNVKSTVEVGSSYSFRNAPQFMSVIPDFETTERDAAYETDATLDTYVFDESCPPFLAIRFCQRFGHSNPSPRYVEAVANAFILGTYTSSDGNSFGTGEYGDLAATIAATLLDREARTPVLDVDPSQGSLREPLGKVLAIMRSLQFTTQPEFNKVELLDMEVKTGMAPYEYPTVFSFFLPENQPSGPVGNAQLVSPETMVLDKPKIISTVNGMFSLIRFGLAECYSGFGENGLWGDCADDGSFTQSRGHLSYTPNDVNNADGTIAELATLLTAGRLSASNRQIIKTAYEAEPSAAEGYRLAQQLIVSSPEFQSTNTIKKSGEPRVVPNERSTNGNKYKATIFMMLDGGVDSYNMLAPYTCGAPSTNPNDLRTQYEEVRQAAATMVKSRLLPVTATGQICTEFGIHENLPILKTLYDKGDALFYANVGVLTKPTNTLTYRDDTLTQVFAHNDMREESRRLDPHDDIRGTGVMGRISDCLLTEGIQTAATSIDSNSIAVVGELSEPSIVGNNGNEEFYPLPGDDEVRQDYVRGLMEEINAATTSDSGFFAETWSSNFATAIAKPVDDPNVDGGPLPEDPTLNEFPNTRLGRKLRAVAQLMKANKNRGVERDVFYIERGGNGYDHHGGLDAGLSSRFTDLNAALDAFVKEMEDFDLWDGVMLQEVSDFARTLTPNGGDGTDHAWGGQLFAIGGLVKGGQVIGEYPDDITDGGPLMLSRGRVIPTTSYDEVWNGIGQWMGCPAHKLDMIVPNLGSFTPNWFNESDIFEPIGPTASPTPFPTTSPPSPNPTRDPASPTVSPTIWPSMAPSDDPFRCCSNNFRDCNVGGDFCNEASNCEGPCGGLWLNGEKLQESGCFARYEECTSDANNCCPGTTCNGNAGTSYRQCAA